MPLLECNKASALRFQQWSAQLSLNMHFFLFVKTLYKNFKILVQKFQILLQTKFLYSRDVHCDGKKLYCNWG
jgi:hypothetical protein